MNEGQTNGVPIRVLVVDDHDLFRTGLASLLGAQPDIEVVAQASGGRMGIRLAGELRPDVVLMDLRMPDIEGAEATFTIMQHDPSMRVLALTAVSEDAAVSAAMRAGASGFLAKDTPINEVVAAVRAAAGGSSWLSPRAAEVVLGRIRNAGLDHDRRRPRSRGARTAVAPRARGAAPDRAGHGQRRHRRASWGSAPGPPRTTCRASSPSWGYPAASRPRSMRSGAAWSERRRRLRRTLTLCAEHEPERQHPGRICRGQPQLGERPAQRRGRLAQVKRSWTLRSGPSAASSSSIASSASQLASMAART